MSPAIGRKAKHHKRLISEESNAKSATISVPDSQATTASVDSGQTAPWRALFFFTTKANLPVLVLGMVCSIIAGLASPAQSFIMGKVFDGLTSYATGATTPEELMRHEKKYILYLVGISGASWMFHSLEFMFWLAFGELQAKSARDRLYHGLLEKDIEWYDMRKNGIGALLPRLQAQIRELQLATSQPLGALFALSSTTITSLAQAFFYSWDLTLVTIATVPVIMGLVIWVGSGTQSAIERQQAKLTEAQKFSTNAFSAIETVKCFNGQGFELKKYMQRISEAAVWYYRVANKNSMQTGLIVLLSSSMFVQGFYYGGVLVSKGKKSSGDVITTFLSAIGAFQALQSILPQMIVLEKGRTAGSTLRAVMAQVQSGLSVQRRLDLLTPASCRGDIDVKGLCFAYPSRPSQLALDDVTLFIPGGDLTFLIGKSGSGKSTLGQLLMRFYNAGKGRISLDGIPLASLDVSWLRGNITLVEQTSLLFNDTVFNNIAFGRKQHGNVTKRQVTEAAEFALLQLMITDMPNGLETVVGYKGGAMSGGQRQRMALARARLRDTPILMLDESTSALDHISRGLMMDAIRHWRRGKTTIIITHDISQILPDDYAFVMEQGKLAQEGYRKHMEKMKDTPFQSFLPPEERATISPYDARKHTAFESIRTRGSSLDSIVKPATPATPTFDPLEAQLSAGETKRKSFLPSVFKEGSPLPAMRAFGKAGPTSAVTSPFLRMAVSPPADLQAKLSRWSPTGPKDDISPSSLVKHGTNSSNRWSAMLEKLMDKTGRFAADSRTRRSNVRKRWSKQQDLEALKSSTKQSQLKTKTEEEPHISEQEVPQQSFKQILRTLWPNTNRTTKVTLMLGFWGGTVHAIGSPLFSFVLSKLLATYGVKQGHERKQLVYSMAILGIAFTDAMHTYAFRFLMEYVGQCWVDNLRNQAMKRILDQPREFFDKDENSVSRMTEGLDRNAEEMRNLLGRFVGMIYIAAFMTAVSVVWALAVQWKLTLLALAVAPYIFTVTNAFSAVSEKWEGHSNDASDTAGSIFTETFNNIKTVRALTLESHFKEKYTDATNFALKVGFMRSLFSGFFYGLSDSAGNFSTALIFYIGSKLVHDGIPVEDVIQVFTMLIFTIMNVSAILEYIPQIGSAKDTASRLLRLAQLKKTSHEHLGNTRINAIGDINFNNLRFAYPARPEQTVLRGIDLVIRPGSSTAIVGGSGSGKSTIANLLLNLYTVSAMPANAHDQTGELTIAGRDINHIYTPSLRSLVTVVSQSPTIFAATVAENIAYGLAPGSQYHNLAAISAAAQLAGIHDFISSLPMSYGTMIGDGGIGLSGGQAQRIAIARALVREPCVLILDEATSALDPESADLVRHTIKTLLDDRNRAITVVIITHHRDMMEIAENIVVLDQGSIVEEGGFEELLAKNGALANLLSGGEWNAEQENGNQKVHMRSVKLKKDISWNKRSKGKPKLRVR